MTLATGDLLTFTVESNGFIDFCRILVAALGMVHLLFAVVRFMNHQAKWAGIAFMATGLLTAMQQAEALGMPLYPWRLPLYALMNIAGIVFLYKMGRDGNERGAFAEQGGRT